GPPELVRAGRRGFTLASGIALAGAGFVPCRVTGRIPCHALRRLLLPILPLARGISRIVIADDIRSAATVLPVFRPVPCVEPLMEFVADLPGVFQRLASNDVMPVRRPALLRLDVPPSRQPHAFLAQQVQGAV